MTASSSSSSSITTLHHDIMQSHILTRLDGQTLASAASTASHLRRLCTEHRLWQNICTATWPSLNDPRVSSLISTFPASHRSIFSDSFPSLHYSSSSSRLPTSPPPPELVSAVDIFYKGKPVFSKVLRTETHKGWFLCSPLWIDLLDHDEVIPTTVKFVQSDDQQEWLKHLEENLNLSWIMIDPTRKRSANLSSRRPVEVRRHWLTGEVEVVYAVVMGMVQCMIKVTCCGKAGGEMHVREVSLSLEDTDGRHVIGKDSLVILQQAMENGKRVKMDVKEVKATFEKFCCMKRERREWKMKIDKAMDMVAMLIAFLFFALLFRFVSFCCF